jgi:hypothetical protein
MRYAGGMIAALLVAAALFCFSAALAADEIAARERERIEYLIDHVAGMSTALFIRNGKEYDAGIAARFLRRKWQANTDKVRTGEDFIEKIASRSLTTGTPYKIRMKDGTEIECGAYLSRLLASHAPGLALGDR